MHWIGFPWSNLIWLSFYFSVRTFSPDPTQRLSKTTPQSSTEDVCVCVCVSHIWNHLIRLQHQSFSPLHKRADLNERDEDNQDSFMSEIWGNDTLTQPTLNHWSAELHYSQEEKQKRKRRLMNVTCYGQIRELHKRESAAKVWKRSKRALALMICEV